MNSEFSGVLPYQEIKLLLGSNEDRTKVILNAAFKQIKSASYDMRLGSAYYIFKEQDAKHDASIKISDLDERKSSTIVIPPHQAVYVTMYESLELPNDVVGHLSLKLNLTLNGVMMSAQSQIDAGYKGNVFALLFNLSNNSVSLSFEDEILRLELVRMNAVTAKVYGGNVGSKLLGQVLKKHVNSSNAQLKDEIEERVGIVDEKLNKFGIIGLVVAFVGVIAPVFLTYMGPINNNENNIIKLEEKVSKLNEEIEEQKRQIHKGRELIRDLVQDKREDINKCKVIEHDANKDEEQTVNVNGRN